ncbi:MAG: hypothetical protein WKF75_08255 [Singulisphaera sp.]
MPPLTSARLWPWSKAFGTSEICPDVLLPVHVPRLVLLLEALRTSCSRATAATALSPMFITKEITSNNARPAATRCTCGAHGRGPFFVLSWGRPLREVAIGAFLAHVMLVTTHYVGCLYSAP